MGLCCGSRFLRAADVTRRCTRRRGVEVWLLCAREIVVAGAGLDEAGGGSFSGAAGALGGGRGWGVGWIARAFAGGGVCGRGGAWEGGERADGVCAGGGAGGGGSRGVGAAPPVDVGFAEEGFELGGGGFFDGAEVPFALEGFFDFGLDGVEGEIFPTVLGFDVGERETVLEEAGDLRIGC